MLPRDMIARKYSSSTGTTSIGAALRPSWDEHAFVVLAYGESPFLPGCLQSLGAQTVSSRIVIATSTPSDYIFSAANEAGAQVAVNPEHRGIGADWNFGLAAARRQYVTLAHQDDIYRPTFLESTLNVYTRVPEAALSFTAAEAVTDAGTPRRSKANFVKTLISATTIGQRGTPGHLRVRLLLSFGNPLPCSSVTFNLGALPKFAFSTALSSNLDWEAWWRLNSEGKRFLHCPQVLVGRRFNDLTETSRLIRSGRRHKEDREMFEAIWPKPIARVLAFLYQAGY